MKNFPAQNKAGFLSLGDEWKSYQEDSAEWILDCLRY